MLTPKISVVLPAYNAERFLSEAIDSILCQTYANFELLAIDDGSSDGTKQLVEKYAKMDPRVRLVCNESNLGLIKTLNKGLIMAKGEYIARMDADDISLPERFEQQVRFLDSNPDVGLLGSMFYVIDSKGKKEYIHYHPTSDNLIRWRLLFGNAFCHSAVMMRRSCVEKVGGYGTFLHVEDLEFWSRLLQVTKASNLPIPLVKWRRADTNISVQNFRFQKEQGDRLSLVQFQKLMGDDFLTLEEVHLLRFWDRRKKVFNCPLNAVVISKCPQIYDAFVKKYQPDPGEEKSIRRDMFFKMIKLALLDPLKMRGEQIGQIFKMIPWL